MATNAPGTPASAALRGELGGVDQVAVVAQRQAGAGLGGAERRLGVLPRGGAGRGVPGVADGEVAAQAAQRRLVEDLADQPEVLVDDDRGAVGHRDPGRLLTAVLEGVQTEIGQLRDLFPRRPDTEDATGVLGSGSSGDRGRASAVHHREAPPESTGVGRRSRVAGGVNVATVRSRPWRAVRPDPCAMLDVARRGESDAQRPTRPERVPRDGPADAARAVRRPARRRRALGGGDALGRASRRPRAERRGAAREPDVRARDARRRGARGPRAERRGDPPAARAHEHRPTARPRTGTTRPGSDRGGDVLRRCSTSPRRSWCRRRARCGRRCRRAA